jgi:hypothetical protein
MRSGLTLGLVAAVFGVAGMVLAFAWDSSRSGVFLALAGVALLIALVCISFSAYASRSDRG